MLKRFISYYKPHIGLFCLDMAAAVVVAVCNLFYPSIAKNIINVYAPNKAVHDLCLWSGILLGIYLLKMFCNYVIGYYGHIVGIRMQHDMRRDLFRKYEKLSFRYFDDHKTGDLLSRLTSDLFDVSELAHHGPENLFLSVLMLIGSFFMLWRINHTLTLIMIGVVPFIILFTLLSRTKMRRSMAASRKQMSHINIVAENSISGIRETKSYAAEEQENRKFDKENAGYAEHRRQAMFALGFYDSIMTFLQDLLYLVIIFVGGIFLVNGSINAGEFAAFVLYIGMFLSPIQRFVSLFQQLEEGMSGFVRFCEVMDLPEEEDGGTQEPEDIRGDIVFDDVSFAYRSEEGETKPVISHLSLSVKAGETLALVGPSGGGKTTLCHLIPRFYNIDEGKITLDGINIRDMKLHSLRRSIGIVSQDVFLFDGTIRDNITYGNENATEEQLLQAAKDANIHDFIMSLEKGYDTEVGERGVKLSGGQKQRIAIARVFLKNPKLLILDEATSALDNVTEMQIQQSLERLAAGRTVIVVAHRLSTVKNADEIAVIDSTGIAEHGTHGELLAKRGIYYTLYSYQFKNLDTSVLSENA